MITSEMKSEIKKLWNALWSGGIANPLNAMEQISYFLYMRRLSVMDEEARLKAELEASKNKARGAEAKYVSKSYFSANNLFFHCMQSLDQKCYSVKSKSSASS